MSRAKSATKAEAAKIYATLYRLADDDGIIQAEDMLASGLTGGRPELDSTQSIASAYYSLVDGIDISEVET